MYLWAIYTATSATIGSIVLLSRIAIVHYDHRAPRSLSELAVDEKEILRHFRGVLLVCGTLFAASVYGFIAPHSIHPAAITLAWTVEYIGVILVAILPAQGKTFWPHIVVAHFMGIGMLLLAYSFWASLTGGYRVAELALLLSMALLAGLTFIDKRRYILYELAFIFTSNFSILIAALALR